ncbi:hypothetical protein MRB53_031263 [Persea americana]|uniref:Uncharacterized protein n=1 Tax=Persea americana TaxID=3435 RepID=A0ACC2KNI6_PERAE|nr:hypothetical protein MRB53_031263 [Persea americana]|eukprot:TRINITY_DN2999_c1_g1_i4.p1 TRINITY_DN2999_c1_g1~~TRINITY_DN2999_c1_g1_i4.p1  ORF type:complete len:527 (-),score=97.27 TRINITY_DN2999_c1_g1_i4:298-1878(-)
MVQHHSHQQLRKREEEEELSSSYSILMECDVCSPCSFSSSTYKKSMPSLLRLFFLFSFFYCSLCLFPRLFNCSFITPFFYLYGTQVGKVTGLSVLAETKERNPSLPCSSMLNGSICCDRTAFRSDICHMKGDVRTSSATFSIFLHSSNNIEKDNANTSSSKEDVVERIRPYTRKWETNIMETIDELGLIAQSANSDIANTCQVQHSVPAIFFSTGGYTGNVYHEFNDGILPLYITSRRYNRRVVFVVLEYHNWWITKYGDIVSRLSDYPPIDFTRDQAVHCFPEAVVGLQIHDELTVTSSLMANDVSIQDFRNLLDEAYEPRILGLIKEEESQTMAPSIQHLEKILDKPKLVILSRNGSRAILNEGEVVELAEEIGFHVQVLRPTRTTELAKIYRELNSSDVMIGVHGAAMTHLLFMRPESVFIQVVVLGTKWAAQTYYGEPAMKLGLLYIGYEILPRESSLYGEYNMNNPELRDPKSITKKGWQETKRVYLDRQNVRLDLQRFSKHLIRAYEYSMSKRKLSWQHQ